MRTKYLHLALQVQITKVGTLHGALCYTQSVLCTRSVHTMTKRSQSWRATQDSATANVHTQRRTSATQRLASGAGYAGPMSYAAFTR